jgi:hypothetical protein
MVSRRGHAAGRPPRARAAWKAQGRYLAALKPLSKAKRLKVRAIRERSGIQAALTAAKRFARQ